MNMKLQKAIDNENLEMSRDSLKEFTGKLKPKSVKIDNDTIDNLHLGFLRADGNDLTFEEMLVIKRFVDYIKSR